MAFNSTRPFFAISGKTITTILGILLTLTWCPTEAKFQCPYFQEIEPCICNGATGELGCYPLASQNHLANLMNKVYALNWPNNLQITSFVLKAESRLTSLDLTPLTQCQISALKITNSPRLSTILRYAGLYKMAVENVILQDTGLSNQDVTNLLSYMDPQFGPINLVVNGSSNIENAQRGSPIIPELSLYNKLESLTLENSQITDLYSGAFIGPPSLSLISLTRNKIKNVEKDAFKIEPRAQTRPLVIDLSQNDLTIDESRRSLEAGFISDKNFGRYGCVVVMRDNRLEYLPEEIFKDLLYPTGPITGMQLQGNRFVCDKRTKWLQSIDEPLKANVEGVDCRNDPGKTVFTTNSVNGATVVTTSNALYFVLFFSFYFA